MKFDKTGFMVLNPSTGEYFYCRNSQDAVDAKLSSSLPCYSARGQRISYSHYRWENPFTFEMEDVHYNEGSKGKALFKGKQILR